jgi:hypothetical protein
MQKNVAYAQKVLCQQFHVSYSITIGMFVYSNCVPFRQILTSRMCMLQTCAKPV